MFNKKQKINCSVESCHYNEDHQKCSLGEIKVCSCNEDDGKKDSTICDSFKKR